MIKVDTMGKLLKKRHGGVITFPLTLLFVAALMAVLFGIILWAGTTMKIQITAIDNAESIDTDLQAILNCNECSSIIKIPLKTLLGAALAKDDVDPINIGYEGKTYPIQLGGTSGCIATCAGHLRLAESGYSFGVWYNNQYHGAFAVAVGGYPALSTLALLAGYGVRSETIVVPPSDIAIVRLVKAAG